MKILLVEDEPKVSAFVKKGLEEQQYQVDVAYDGNLGKRLALQGQYDLVILDVILPYMSGVELCREIRKLKDVPILMLTALGTTEDKVSGFDAGADDYLVKPFDFAELLARVKSLTRRSSGIKHTSQTLQLDDLVLNLDKKIVSRGEKDVALTAREFALLEFFMRNPNRVLSRMDIFEKVWDIHFDTGTNVVDVYVNILRKKINEGFEKKFIHTRIGLGYIFKD